MKFKDITKDGRGGYHDEDNEYLNKIITGDETWVENCDKLTTFPDGRFI